MWRAPVRGAPITSFITGGLRYKATEDVTPPHLQGDVFIGFSKLRALIMQRVVILGRGGAGKSTFARKLGATTGLPVIELDKYFWQPGLVPTPREQWTEIQKTLASQDCWIMDGDLGRYDDLTVRLKAADTVLILDFGLLLCLRRALRRSRERAEFWWWLASWRWRERPKIKRAIAEYAGHAEVRIFSRPAELESFFVAKFARA